ncbi:FG-GAP-like repeat-containing protein [Shewanella algae]|uniref:FG-GAP-like repeat-containing protein n=1 Tax=Shewanella algae TaxID=38313 RepID=UPI001AACD1D4|nr:FG-GAP-like repeat-containing protein [Shewanella algae]MBO2659326.1 VCBS repeat-containing protein [Shewanella algae]
MKYGLPISLFLLSIATQNNVFASSSVPLNGSFRVSEQGAATYTIPIDTPAARGKLKPAVELSYSSGGGETIMGLGWGLQGLSAISRCPKTIEQDGYLQGVELTNKDSYCLDGARLVLTAGTHSLNGAEYRKELDDASVVTVIGQAPGGGPAAFKVETKSGDTYFYGDVDEVSGKQFLDVNGTSSSGDGYRSVSQNNSDVIYHWSLKAVEDSVGNYISYHYENTAGEQYLKSIDYAGHSNGEAPYNQVRFIYTPLSYPKYGYSYGTSVAIKQQLQKIEVRLDDEVDKTYYLTYHKATSSDKHDYLEQVKACIGQTQTDCSTPITFEWDRQASASAGPAYQPFSGRRALSIPSGNNDTAKFFDMDGDGLSDIVYVRDGRWYKRGIQSGIEQALASTGAGKAAYAQTIDYDGDGQRDLLVANSETANWQILSFKPSTYQHTVCEPNGRGTQLCEDVERVVNYTLKDLGLKAIGLEGKALVADVNGDALEDIIFIDGGAIKWYRNLGNGSFAAAQSLYSFPSTEVGHNTSVHQWHSSRGFGSSFMDINGDGLTDFMLEVREREAVCISGSGKVISGVTENECRMDIRGTWSVSDYEYWNLYVSTGSSYQRRQKIYRGPYNNINIANTLRSADFNGDGLSDIAYVHNNKWFIQLSDGNGFLPRIDTGITTSDTQKYKTYFIDIAGDGRAEMVVQHTLNQALVYHSNPELTSWTTYGVINDLPYSPLSFADIDGRGKLDIVSLSNGQWQRLTHKSHAYHNTIKGITDGFGVKTRVTYAPLTEKSAGEYSVYKTQVSSYLDNSRNFSLIPPQKVVKQVATETGDGSQVSVNYEYGGLLINRLGRGPAGFELLRTIDNQTQVVTETIYHQLFPQIGLPLATKQTYQGKTLYSAINEYSFQRGNDGIYRRVEENVVERTSQYGSDGVVRELTQTNTQTQFDDWGNAIAIKADVTDLEAAQLVSRVETVNQYDGHGGGEAKGRLSHTRVTKSRFNQREQVQAIVTESAFSYYDNGLLMNSTVSPNDNRYKLTTGKTYDIYGNTLTERVSGGVDAAGNTQQSRQMSYLFDARGRLLKTVTNAAGDSSTYTYNGQSADQVTGKITQITVTDANGRKLTKDHDKWGRLVREVTPDGVPTSYQYATCDAGCSPLSHGHLVTTKTKAGAPQSKVITDKYGREVGKQKQGFDGQWIVTATSYDAQGRPVRQYEPAFAGISAYYTEIEYDHFGRVINQTNPNGGVSSIQYLGFETLTIDPNGKQKRAISNAMGEQFKVVDDIGNELEFVYDAGGKLMKSFITSASGQELLRTEASYDAYGRKISTKDIDKGQWRYTYNAFGEMLSQTNGKSQSSFIYYDILGRKVRQTEPDGTSCWTYGNKGSKTAGLLIAETRFDTVVSNCSQTGWVHSKQSGYDSAGRLASSKTSIAGSSYEHRFSYDSHGRAATQTYPNNLLTVVNHYNAQGYLFKRTDQQTGKAYQTITEMNARGQVEQVRYGNGAQESTVFDATTGWVSGINLTTAGVTAHQLDYRFDTVGNLEYRQHSLSSAPATFSENYHYDDLYRLYERTVSIHSGGTSLPSDFKATHEMQYDDLGNITFKTGVGDYRYDSTNPYRLASIANTSTIAASKSCPAGYAFNSSKTSCLKTETRAATAVCPVGYSWNGSNCQKAISTPATPVCQAGYSWSGSQCLKTVSSPATAVCAAGYNWNGSTCQKTVTSQATATCSAGYTYNSTAKRCEKKVVSSAAKTCPAGYSYSSAQDKCTQTSTTWAKWVCTGSGGGGRDPKSTIPEFSTRAQVCDWKCPSGYNNVWPGGEQCKKTELANYTYTCPTGSTLSGSSCTKLQTQSNGWSCPAGSTLSGSSCNKVVTQNNTWSCPAGSTLSGSVCNKNYTAAPSWSCPAGTALSGTNCTGTQTASPSSWSCPSGWSVSGSSCRRQLSAAVIYSCPANGVLNGSSCLISDGPSHTMTYDNNGNITQDGSRRFTYSSYDLVTNITQGGESTRFKYDANRQRFERYDVKVEAGVTSYLTTLYVGGYEKVTRSGGNKPALTEQKLYVGNLVITKRSNNTVDEFYLHKDHQGSTTTITNKSGNVVQQFTYDPWGKQTAAYSHSLLNDYIAPAASKGYTGHEGIDNLNLIHMNGRIYDPTIGRFLQADSHIQAPNNGQSYNRYSYVLNNPMSHTDPSGYFFKKLYKALGKIDGRYHTHKHIFSKNQALANIVQVGLNYIPVFGQLASAHFAFDRAFYATGSLRAAFKSGVVTYATGYILSEIGNHSWWGQAGSPQNIAANAIVGGISSELQGGSFGHGFWAAGFASVAKPMIYEQWGFSPDKRVQRVAAAAIIGGTASAVSGGKFANGAMTGAFNQLYNGETYASKKWNEVKGIASKMYDTYLNSTQSIGISYEMPWRVDGEWQSFGLEVGFVSQSLFHPDGFAFGIYWMTTAGGSLFPWGDIKGTIDITVSQGNLKDFSGSGLIGDVQTPFGGMSVAKSNSGLWAGSFAPGVGLGAGAGIYSTRVLAIGRYYPAECSEFICQ